MSRSSGPSDAFADGHLSATYWGIDATVGYNTRMGGAAIAISIYGAIVSSGLTHVQIALPGGVDFRNLTPEGLAALPDAARALVANAYSEAFVPLFLTASGMMVIGLICALLLPNIRLPREGEGKVPAPASE